MKYVLAIDQGTTSTRAILFDRNGHLLQIAQREVACLFPKPDWVEVDALAIWVSVTDVINEVLIKSNISINDIATVGLTNQRETTVVWSKKTGMPVYNAIVWQSRQSIDICNNLSKYQEVIQQKTGLLINPYFSASKVRFILDATKNGQQKAENGELLFGTIDSWIIYKMTMGKVHATDVTNASRTLLFNINTLKWDEELCSLFNIPMKMLPTVCPSAHDYGSLSYLKSHVHITGVLGDQQAALFGQTCFEKGESKNTYGTGCFLLLNTGDKLVFSKKGLLTTIAWQIGDKVTYALEGSVFIGGAVVQWLRDEMHLIKSSDDSESVALESPSGGVYVVPAFAGLGTPYWDDKVQGAVFGLTRSTNRSQFVRASLESIAYQCKDVVEVMQEETKIPLKLLKVDGGATKNRFLMQFQSDLLQTEIRLPRCLETTALGVAYMAGLQCGFFKSLDNIKKIHEYQAVYTPYVDKKEVDRLYEGWKKAIKATRIFK
ncbi:MAG TPA: glycerol kinase GlpK [Erysipelotrichaceae bacterium]|nr:glycerol kinase GlpK [Erysipelotrichaceae bacterium]